MQTLINSSKRHVFLFVILLFTAGFLLSCSPKEPSSTVFYLVRHAEKELGPDVGRNPALATAGHERATELARILSKRKVTHIHSTDYIRTQSTAAPLAKAMGLEVQIYDPRNLETFAQTLKSQKGRHLIVGHSNTTPQLSLLLGSSDFGAIHEKSEYDRLYTISLAHDGTIFSRLERYGVRFPAKP